MAPATLVRELTRPGVIYEHPRKDLPADIRPLLGRVGDRLRDRNERLLIVLDQFEEFLIVLGRNPAEQAAFAELLVSLYRQPIDGIWVLLVLRSDYQPALYDLDLPRLHAGTNWMEVGPFPVDLAQGFLAGSKLNLGPRLMEAIIRRASELDETPGYVRPIVLNLIGRALEARQTTSGVQQFGRRDVQNLLLDFVRAGLRAPETSEYAPRVLREMITPEGTKVPKAIEELAGLTAFAPKMIAACLTRLAFAFGFVRQLNPEDERSVEKQHWEVAHDFLARLLSLVLSGWRPTLWTRFRPWLAPALIALAIAVIPLTLKIGHEYRLWKLQRWADAYQLDLRDYPRGTYAASQRLTDDIASRQPIPVADAIHRAIEEHIADLIGGLDVSNSGLEELPPEVGQLHELIRLDASHNNLTRLPPELAELKKLSALILSDNPGLRRIPPDVFSLSDLTVLDVAGSNLEEVSPEIQALSKLNRLHVPRNQLKRLPPEVGQLGRLKSLLLSRNDKLTALPKEIGKLHELEELHISNCALKNLPPEIGELKKLQRLFASDNQLSELPEAIGQLQELKILDLSNNELKKLPGTIAGLSNLRELKLSGTSVIEQSPEITQLKRAGTRVSVGKELGKQPGKGRGDGSGGGGGRHRGSGGRDRESD
jgi:hypothetical protein